MQWNYQHEINYTKSIKSIKTKYILDLSKDLTYTNEESNAKQLLNMFFLMDVNLHNTLYFKCVSNFCIFVNFI